MILMKDPPGIMSSNRPSHFYVSRDYGNHFDNITHKFMLNNGTIATISNFYSSKADHRQYILVAKYHKMLFVSTDECNTFTNVSTPFHPESIKFHPRYSYYVLAHEGSMGSKQVCYIIFGWLIRFKKIITLAAYCLSGKDFNPSYKIGRKQSGRIIFDFKVEVFVKDTLLKCNYSALLQSFLRYMLIIILS